MEITGEKEQTAALHLLTPGDTFISGERAFIVTDNNIIPAPLPDYIYCVNLESGRIAVFTSADEVYPVKIRGEIHR